MSLLNQALPNAKHFAEGKVPVTMIEELAQSS
jgi:hypothetical protein